MMLSLLSAAFDAGGSRIQVVSTWNAISQANSDLRYQVFALDLPVQDTPMLATCKLTLGISARSAL
jgi:hypothetical protein